MICDFCKKPRDKFEIDEIHTQGCHDTSLIQRICRYCILKLKGQLSAFDLTFWVKDGKGHFNSWSDAATFYIKGDVVE